MYKNEVNKITKALGLKREIVGVKFLYTKEDYENIDIDEYGYKTSLCMMVKRAADGELFKCKYEHFGCRCGVEAVGVAEPMTYVESGERYYACRLYESRAVAKATQREVIQVKHKVYGVAFGPLKDMEDVDTLVFMGDGFQLMRVIQGYTYRFGVAKNIQMSGNQGVCSDLVARPYEVNDLNISVLCAGTRKMCRWEDSEMGVGLPINMLSDLTTGIIETLNLIEYPDKKKLIEERLEYKDELGIEIDYDIHYGKLAGNYTSLDKK